MSGRDRDQLAKAFRDFAAHCLPSSPLYHDLSLHIADDDTLLTLAAATRQGQPPANMLFGAAHYLLLRDRGHPAAAFYPTLGGSSAPGPAAFAAFRDLCLAHVDEVAALLRTRLTQTNETRRCVYLLPAFAAVAREGGDRPLALLEIGPSAGLNMLWDRYGYSYGDGRTYGDPTSPVQLSVELRGPGRPPLPERTPEVAWRAGVDISPVALGDPDAVRWLEALIWPENVERVERLRAAAALAGAHPPRLVAGDALELLPGLLAEMPAGATRCVYHTHVTYQFTPEMRERVDALLADAGRRGPVARVSCEHAGAEHPRLALTWYADGAARTRPLATTTGHANWLAWEPE